MKTSFNRNAGFTLTEALVAAGLMTILVAASVPNLTQMLRSNRMQADVAFLRSGFQLARSEAVSRNSTVSICSTIDRLSCGGTFKDGWIVFDDLSGDQVRDAGEDIIRVGDRDMEPEPENTERILIVSDGTHAITFNGQGRSDRAVQFDLCDPEGRAGDRQVRVMPTGQINASLDPAFTC